MAEELKPIRMDRKYRYRNGEPARVLCVDASGEYPVISLTTLGAITRHKSNGFFLPKCKESRHDLIEVAPVIETFGVFRPDSFIIAVIYLDLETAKSCEASDAQIVKIATQNGKLTSVEIVE